MGVNDSGFTYLNYALSLPVEHNPQTTVFIQLCLVLLSPFSSSCTGILAAVHISFSATLFQVFLEIDPILLSGCVCLCAYRWRDDVS